MLVALAAAPAALAAAPSVAEVRGPADDLLSSAGTGPFAYPDVVGSGVRVGDATADARGVELYDVSLLGGRVWAYRVYVPTKGLRDAAIDSLVIGGRKVSVTPNKVVHLAPRTVRTIWCGLEMLPTRALFFGVACRCKPRAP